MAPMGQMASQVLQRMQISGSMTCCLMTMVSVLMAWLSFVSTAFVHALAV
jgi:hypothetical protein